MAIRVATNELEEILQSELDQAGRNYRLGDLAKIRRGRVQVQASRAGWDGEHRVVEEIEEVSPELDPVPLANVEILHNREVHAFLKRTTVDVAHAPTAEAG